jgi:hypothetical protein
LKGRSAFEPTLKIKFHSDSPWRTKYNGFRAVVLIAASVAASTGRRVHRLSRPRTIVAAPRTYSRTFFRVTRIEAASRRTQDATLAHSRAVATHS